MIYLNNFLIDLPRSISNSKFLAYSYVGSCIVKYYYSTNFSCTNSSINYCFCSKTNSLTILKKINYSLIFYGEDLINYYNNLIGDILE
jgi:hypothetical protein